MPKVDAPVYSLAAGPANTSVFIGGFFKIVNGVASRAVAKLSMIMGARFVAFRAVANWGDVRSFAVYGVWFYIGGTFSAISGVKWVGLVWVNNVIGVVDIGFDVRIAALG